MLSETTKDKLHEKDCKLNTIYLRMLGLIDSIQDINNDQEEKNLELTVAIECLQKAEGYIVAAQSRLLKIYNN